MKSGCSWKQEQRKNRNAQENTGQSAKSEITGRRPKNAQQKHDEKRANGRHNQRIMPE
jgi:hypothetical protein